MASKARKIHPNNQQALIGKAHTAEEIAAHKAAAEAPAPAAKKGAKPNPFLVACLAVNPNFDRKTGLTDGERTKVLAKLAPALDEWLEAGKASKSGKAPVRQLDPEWIKTAAKHLHKILSETDNALDLQLLGGYFALESGAGRGADAREEAIVNIKAYATDKVLQTAFRAVQSGPRWVIYRVQDGKGKATGVQVPEAKTRGSSSSSGESKTVERFTDKVSAATGIPSKARFEQVVKALGRDVKDKSNLPTIGELKNYQSDNS